MTKSDFPLTDKEFKTIYAKVPRLTVEVLIDSEEGIYLTKRTIEPCKGQWHLPGGKVYFGESLIEAVKRIASRELGIEVIAADNLGVIEYPSHYLNGLDAPVGIVYKVLDYKGYISLSKEADSGGWFKNAPKNMHSDQDKFLIYNGWLKAS